MCDSCQILRINGIITHETGCPNSFKDKKVICKECGQEFVPEEKYQKFCSEHCYAIYNGYFCDCGFCKEMEAENVQEN